MLSHLPSSFLTFLPPKTTLNPPFSHLCFLPQTRHTESRAVLCCSSPALITVFQYLKAATKTTHSPS